MDAEQVDREGRAPRHQLLARGESTAIRIGLPVAVLVFGAMGASAYWSYSVHRDAWTSARGRQIEAIGSMLSQSAETMLAAGELSALRRLTAEAARNHDLTRCRIVLPDGKVVADADPSQITAAELPKRWKAGLVTSPAPSGDEGVRFRAYSLRVAGKGPARLEIAGRLDQPIASGMEAATGVGLIAVGALGSLLVIYRRIRRRLRGLGAVQGALLASADGEASPGSLTVGPQFGREAAAWNEFVARQQGLQEQLTLERAKKAVVSGRSMEREAHSACEAMSQGLLFVGENLTVDYANGAAAAFLQADRGKIVGADIAEVVSDEQVLEAVRAAADQSVRRRSVVELEGSGESGVLRFSVRPTRREDSAAAMVVIEDITQQRVAERARNAFVAHATHELRTPLTNILLYVETALDKSDDAKIRAESLNIINQESRRLERMVGDMLSVAEIEAGSFKLKKDDVRLAGLLQQIEADYKAQAEEKGIEFVLDLPPKVPVVQGDRDKIVLALHNLVGNALKYTPSGGKVEVTMEVGADELLIEVADTGIGISEEDAGHVFERFYRAKDPRVVKVTGSGLGLALSREILRLHGGDITLESEPENGSTFTVRLPMGQEAG
jgi:signal transduction histidine kinase